MRFRLDSMTRGGDLAWVSLRGDLSRGDGVDARGARYATTGKVSGQFVLDRRRGWLADSYTAFVVDAAITPPPDAGAKPMKVRMKVIQRLKAR